MRRILTFALILCMILTTAVPSAAFAAKPAPPTPPPPTSPQGLNGSVTSAGSAQGIAGAVVTAFTYSKTKGWQSKASTSTASDGTFALLLGPGTYRVEYRASNYTTEYYDGASAVTSAKDVVVTSGAMTPCSAVLTSPFIEGGTHVSQSGLDVRASWSAGVGPYEIWRSSTPSSAGSWELVGTTTELAYVDKAPFRMNLVYKVRSAGSNQWAAPSDPILISAGTGTSADPYLVRTLPDLDNVRLDGGASYRQIADIDASPTRDPQSRFNNGGAGLAPIGTPKTAINGVHNVFWGEYDGADYAVTGLYINRPAQNYVGLFAMMTGAKVSGVNLVDADICGSNMVGALAGMVSSGLFTNLPDYGIPSDIAECSASSTVRGGQAVGGLCGAIAAGSTLSQSSANAVVTGTLYRVGGLAGTSGGSLSRCWSAGSVSAPSYAGGLTGSVSGQDSLCTDSYSLAAVMASTTVGGLAGRLEGVGATIKRCYSAGLVLGGENGHKSGLVGDISDWTLQYVIDSYWDSQTSGVPTGGGYYGQPKTTLEMQTESTFSNWDFINMWNPPVAGTSYPTLRADAPAAPTGIAGTVTDGYTGQPIAAADVRFFASDGAGGWQDLGVVQTDASGRYSRFLAPGTYRLSFWALKKTTEFYPDASSLWSGEDVVVTSGQTVELSASLRSQFLDQGVTAVVASQTVSLSWGQGAGVYHVYRSTNPSDTNSWTEVGATANKWWVDPMAPLNVPVYYKVYGQGDGLWAGPSSAVTVQMGTGTPSDPYIVRTLEDLNNVRRNLSASYRQVADIDAGSISNWQPIGTEESPFSGVYDGGGRVIDHLTINSTSVKAGGLFGLLRYGGSVRNLGVVNASITMPHVYTDPWRTAGIVAATLADNATIDHCYATGAISAHSDMSVGGLAGSVNWGSAVRRSWANVAIYGQPMGGHLIGLVQQSQVSDCYATGQTYVSWLGSQWAAGGLIAHIWLSAVNRCYSYATITWSDDFGTYQPPWVHGFIGWLEAGSPMAGSYYDADVLGRPLGDPWAAGMSHAAMQDPATYAGWDFVNVWNPPVPGVSYPTLR